MLRLLTASLAFSLAVAAADPKVLVYTRNYTPDGKGYVHDNVAASVEAIKKIGAERGFTVVASADPSVFTKENLKQFKVIVFSNSNNEAFENDAQREAFKDFVHSKGGVVGIHSATGSERAWPWYWALMGGKFLRHPKMQPFTVRVTEPSHPAARSLPASFEWTDECYYHDKMAEGLHYVLVTDPAKLDDPKKDEYPGTRFGDRMPLAWYHTFEGGRVFYTALGHKIEHYSDPRLVAHISGAIQWAMGKK